MNFKITPYYARSRKDFYVEHLFPKDPKRYCDFEVGKENFISSKRTVSFKNISFGESEANAVKIVGQPRYVIEKPYAQFPIKVLFYREQLNNLRIISQLHFFEDRFFYACYSIVNWTNADLIEYMEIILNKYYGEKNVLKMEKEAYMEKMTTLIDEENNHLIINADVYLQFIYYSPKNEIPNYLEQLQIAEENIKLKQQQIVYNFF